MRTLFYLLILSVVVLDVKIVLAQGPEINLTVEERAWLKAHPKIVLGLDAGWKTAARVDKDGVLTGYSVDFVQLINKKTGTNIQLKRGG
jgi:ABC-type amino acid transport substrate-binding protein